MLCLLFFVLSLCYSFFSFCSVCVCLFLWFPLCFLLCFASLFLWFALFVPPCLCDCVSGSLSIYLSIYLSRASLVFLSVRFFLVRVFFLWLLINGIVGRRRGLGLVPFLPANEAVNSPALAGLLIDLETRSWAGDVVRFWCHFFLLHRSPEEGDEQ